MSTERDVSVREVGLRDGLQGIATFFDTEAKKRWIEVEAAAGVPEIEVCSFVPPKVSIQFTDARETVAHAQAQPGLEVSALVPNEKGAELGIAAGARKLNFVLSASEGHNQANVNCSREASLERFSRIADICRAHPGVRLGAGVATAFGCTIEGPIASREVLWIVEELCKRGAQELSLADTVGYATPRQVGELFRSAFAIVGERPLSAHFHDTRGVGLANVVPALEAGVRGFDASLAGLGGCPYAPGATGNIVMEDLVFMLEGMGLKTGVDVDALLPIREIIAGQLPEIPLYGAIAKAGLPKGFAQAA